MSVHLFSVQQINGFSVRVNVEDSTGRSRCFTPKFTNGTTLSHMEVKLVLFFLELSHFGHKVNNCCYIYGLMVIK